MAFISGIATTVNTPEKSAFSPYNMTLFPANAEGPESFNFEDLEPYYGFGISALQSPA